MKHLITSLGILISALIVSVFMFTIGTLYSLGYSIWSTITLKDWKAFFKFWWKLIDGFCHAIGHVLYHVAYALDLGWNVNGEILEDFFTHKEDTMFTEKGITVSAAIGKLESERDLNKTGLWFSRVLNKFFNQKAHAVDSWRYYVDHERFINEYFN